jgi:hypothetical protein
VLPLLLLPLLGELPAQQGQQNAPLLLLLLALRCLLLLLLLVQLPAKSQNLVL